MNTKWKDMTSMQKVGLVITLIGAILILVSMMKPDIFPVNMTTPAIAVMSAGEAMEHWQKNRKWFWPLAGAAVICMACFILELCML